MFYKLKVILCIGYQKLVNKNDLPCKLIVDCSVISNTIVSPYRTLNWQWAEVRTTKRSLRNMIFHFILYNHTLRDLRNCLSACVYFNGFRF